MATLKYKHWTLEPHFRGELNQEIFDQGIKALALVYQVPESSIGYLLNNGWKQSLQDAYAGPRAKAVNDKESEEVIAAVIETSVKKRIDSIKKGMVASSGGRDPVISVAKYLLGVKAESMGKKLPKDKDELDKLVQAWVPKHMDEIKAEIAKRKAQKGPEVTLEDFD